ncbi:hypothetical protein KGO95_04055 [Patescibacteria group bacterium]|nr:hypothetical protein [Patescibacteria group bacterium]
MKRPILLFISLMIIAALGGASFWLLKNSQQSAAYLGLPAAPCVDSTKPLVQNFTVRIAITVNGADAPLSPTIGHDPGDCLRVLYTNDASGVVNVTANDSSAYTLGAFFGVWRQKFDATHFMGYPIDGTHALAITENGDPVTTGPATALIPNATYDLTYTASP